MIRDAVTSLGTSLWAIVGLVLCFIVFVGIVIWTYRGRRDRFERESRLPLDDDHRELNGTHS